MGERKGQNKYYPPDYDPKKGGLNKFLGTHALRERARKLHMGILVIRFEMPYDIWCEGCGNHVARGVRYNAEKSKIGMYYTTPVYKFRMKCHLCNNYFEIKTDPEHFDYEIISGLRRQEKRWQPEENDQIVATEKETSKKLATDAMFKLEHGETDLKKGKVANPELAQLVVLKSRMSDDYAQNQLLRKLHRTKRKDAKSVAAADAVITNKYGLAIPLAKEHADDVRLASLLAKYRTVQNSDEKLAERRLLIEKRSIFAKRQKSETDANPQTKKITEIKARLSSDRLAVKKLKMAAQLSTVTGQIDKSIHQCAASTSKQSTHFGSAASYDALASSSATLQTAQSTAIPPSFSIGVCKQRMLDTVSLQQGCFCSNNEVISDDDDTSAPLQMGTGLSALQDYGELSNGSDSDSSNDSTRAIV